jgi:hypothetical protein
MEIKKLELNAVEAVVVKAETSNFSSLSALGLALVGSGSGDISLG